MSVCIYLFQNRIIHWAPHTLFSKPVQWPHTSWFIVNGEPPMPLQDMVAKQNVGYTLQRGYFTVEESLPANWEDRFKVIRQLQVLINYNALANTHKLKYTDNSLGQALADVLLVDELREFKNTGNLENCLIIQSLLETSEAGLTAEALVTKLWLKYETYRNVVANLNRIEFKLRQLLEQDKIDAAKDLLYQEFEKLKA